MVQAPLRIRFLALLSLGVLAITIATLLVVRNTISKQIRAEILRDLQGSVLTFQAFQSERKATLSHSAALLADLPTLKALMTTQDMATIQDASNSTWNLSGGDLMVLATPGGKIMAEHTTAQQITHSAVQGAMRRSLQLTVNRQWWFLDGHLYEVFFQPIYFGRSSEERLLGILALGYEINERVAADVSRITGSQVTFLYGDTVVASTIALAKQGDFAHQNASVSSATPQDFQLGQERFLTSSVELAPDVRLSVFKSYDEATAHYQNLYRTLAGLGILALFGQSFLAFAVFGRYTSPLEKLVSGVRALGKGDFAYPLEVHGRDELAEATTSFLRMRDDLQQIQRRLLESERLATIGRMASSISHDLRHQLTSVVANAEFLSEPNLEPDQAAELYQEIRDAVGRMTEIIDSLLEFSRTRAALTFRYVSLEETMQGAIGSVQSHPSVEDININLSCNGNLAGWFDSKKLERAFYNLLLNACQAVSHGSGKVDVDMHEVQQGVEILISDNGPGIPENLRDRIFEPFMSYGKENGTGLGLTIVQKILEDHGGTIKLLDASRDHTTFSIMLPVRTVIDEEGSEDPVIGISDNASSSQMRD
jgi:signal transduction histidine kinase